MTLQEALMGPIPGEGQQFQTAKPRQRRSQNIDRLKVRVHRTSLDAHNDEWP